MITREDLEKKEFEYLSPLAAKSAESRGRVMEEEKSQVRTEYQRDRDRIIHSKSFRRLMHKTQVFLAPEGDHFRTRLTHTIEVSQIARTIARGLALNEDLTEAIALGHDLGHTPFGHSGETILNNIHPGGFQHNVQSLRVVEVLEGSKGKAGMNLTAEVKDGIVNHTGPTKPFTLEGQIVRFSDRIAYINHDIDDALRSGVIKMEDLPEDCLAVLGNTHRQRIDTLVMDVIVNSDGQPVIVMSDSCQKHMDKLRAYMFKNVYHNEKVKRHEDLHRVEIIINSLYDYYLDHPDQLPKERQELIAEHGIAEIVKDHVAGMTDRYALNLYNEIFIPKGWK
ncbi:deoxyguanosinetriphosphate triphosphohydrolase [Aminipila butyrica]|uniref:Deoxyguanosinetriphosphate triphosphohydrolase-like protein n=1 Tax=Aminipila butyrica TaxID=433296 RepID=A0A858BU66_9FIRM|nr:deoxyguanosinetriphosphate triphosphohydrolase [Aminipila butyrica]QIB69483.1 deoxyguanosinetriphosphate triphosphohydrolase [Aminipila butyrica]